MAIIRNYFKVCRVFPDPSDYFYIKNETLDQFTLEWVIHENRTDIEFKIDNGSWTGLYNYIQSYGHPQIPAGSKMYLRTSAGYWLENTDESLYFVNYDGQDISLGGDIRTIIDYTDVESVTSIPAECFHQTFAKRSDGIIISIENISFDGITSIGNGGLFGTFMDQNELTKGLDLSGVTTLGNNSLNLMYANCTSLNEAYAPNVSTWDTDKTSSWLNNTASTGVLYKPANLVIDTDTDSGVPSGWTTQTYPQA